MASILQPNIGWYQFHASAHSRYGSHSTQCIRVSRNRYAAPLRASHSCASRHPAILHGTSSKLQVSRCRTHASNKISQESEARHEISHAHFLESYPPEGDLQGKTVVVIGLGASGRAAAMLALARGADKVIGVDRNPDILPLEEDASVWSWDSSSHARENATSRLQSILGRESLGVIRSAAVVVASPGVPLHESHVALALERGIPVLSELAFSFECLPASLPVAAVSGTNGKSTVATFTGQILEGQGVRAFVGGNLGTPLAMLAVQYVVEARGGRGVREEHESEQAQRGLVQVAVVEVSSYQMELPGSFRPKAAVILNLTPDHLERHGSMEAYGAAKCRMFARMEPSDVAIIPHGSTLLTHVLHASQTRATVALLGALPGALVDHESATATIQLPVGAQHTASGANPKPLCLHLSALTAIGRHNRENAAAAALLCCALELPNLAPSLIQQTLPNLTPPPHRMQLVHKDEWGVQWINDSKATNVESSLVGIAGLTFTRPEAQSMHQDNRSDGESGREVGELHAAIITAATSSGYPIDSRSTGSGNPPVREQESGADGNKPGQPRPPPGAVVLLGGIAKVLKSSDGGGSSAVGGLGFWQLVEPLNRQRAVVTFGQSGAAIADELQAGGLSVPLIRVDKMRHAVELARTLALPGDAVLLSPACASFDEFQNFEHRGKVFVELASTGGHL